MTYRRYSAGLVLAAVAVLGLAGCAGVKDKPTGDAPVPNAAPSVPASSAAGGALVKGADLEEFTISMPPPKGAPTDGTWSDVRPGEDGRVDVYYVDKKAKGYLGVEFIDCRLPAAQAAKDDSENDQGVFAFCFKKPTKTLKGYPMMLPDEDGFGFRALVVNHLTILATTFVGFEQFKPADIEEFLGTLDLDTLAKL